MNHTVQSRMLSDPLAKYTPVGLLQIKSQHTAATFLLQLLKRLKVASDRKDFMSVFRQSQGKCSSNPPGRPRDKIGAHSDDSEQHADGQFEVFLEFFKES